mgnify:CR=1 FL=1
MIEGEVGKDKKTCPSWAQNHGEVRRGKLLLWVNREAKPHLFVWWGLWLTLNTKAPSIMVKLVGNASFKEEREGQEGGQKSEWNDACQGQGNQYDHV